MSEIIDLTNLLEWLAEPANSIALVGLLRSPFFAIDDESLIALTESARVARVLNHETCPWIANTSLTSLA